MYVAPMLAEIFMLCVEAAGALEREGRPRHDRRLFTSKNRRWQATVFRNQGSTSGGPSPFSQIADLRQDPMGRWTATGTLAE